MKKKIIQMLVLTLSVLLMLSGCSESGKNKNDNDNDKTDELTDDLSMENPYINSPPGYEMFTKDGYIMDDAEWLQMNSYSEYCKQKELENPNLGKWLLWEQFSALGEFHKAMWWEGQPETSEYEYLYTDPNSGDSWIYNVNYIRGPKSLEFSNEREFFQWYWGRELSEIWRNAPTYSAKDFKTESLLEKNKGGVFYYNDDLRLGTMGIERLSSISFYYNGWHVSIYKFDSSSSKNCPFDAEKDAEIIRRLLNVNTYKQAIEELMDPKNAVIAD